MTDRRPQHTVDTLSHGIAEKLVSKVLSLVASCIIADPTQCFSIRGFDRTSLKQMPPLLQSLPLQTTATYQTLTINITFVTVILYV